MVLRELSEQEWQNSFVAVLQLAGSGASNRPDTSQVLGDVKHIMDKTIGRRALKISGPVSAANYWEAKTALLNLTGRFVYIQVRPIGDKVMTFHLDVLDSGGRPERVTFSTLYSAPPSTPTGIGGGGGGGGGFFKRHSASTGADKAAAPPPPPPATTTLGGSAKTGKGATATSSATTLDIWKGGGGTGGGWAATKGEAAADSAAAAAGSALVKRGGALRYPVSFDTSRSRGWSVIAIDMVALMRDAGGRKSAGPSGGGGRGYGLLRAVRLGSNMVVRGVYASDCVYSPHTLPKEMAFRTPGRGLDWEAAYNWLWVPEVPDENAAPPPEATHRTNRPTWPPGADSPTSSVAAADAAEARERRRMEKRHFFSEPGPLRKLLAHQGTDDEGEAAAPPPLPPPPLTAETPPGRGRSPAPGIRGRANSSKSRRDSGGVSVGAAFPRTPRRSGDDVRGRSASVRRTPPVSPRPLYAGGGGGVSFFHRSPMVSPARMRPVSSANIVGGGGRGTAAPAAAFASPSPRSWRGVLKPRDRSVRAPSPTAAAAAGRHGKPPLSPTRRGGTQGAGSRGRAFFSSNDRAGAADAGALHGGGGSRGGGNGVSSVDVGGGSGVDDRPARGEAADGAGGDWNWTREELEAWPGREHAPATPVVDVLENGGGDERRRAGERGENDDGDAAEEGGERVSFQRSGRGVTSGGGMDPPVLTRVLPPGLETSRPDPPEFDPDPALHLERALGYTGGLPATLAFVGRGAELMAFPCNNVIVVAQTPVMPEAVVVSEEEQEGEGFSVGSDGARGSACRGGGEEIGKSLPPPHVFLRGHTDTITRLQLSHAGHLLASAQGDPLGAAGGHGIVRIWDATSLDRGTAIGDGGSGQGTGGSSRTSGGGGGGGGAKCAAHFIAHRWGVLSMCFSSDDRLLCTVGGDEHRRTQIIVWDVALLCTSRAGTVHGAGSGLAVVARQISDFPITKMRFSPFEKLRLVSCGRENVRFWRVRRRHLPACPAVLNDFARDLECTDLAFQSSCGGIAGVEDRTDWAEGPCVVYVSSRAGTVLQVSYHTRNLLCVLQLHRGPILSLEVNADYAVTGSEDKFLRLWPLDFSDFLMEAAHESSVVSVCTSMDGLKLAVGTSAGSIGVVDVMTHGYTTALRSHQGGVTAAVIDPLEEREEFATVSEDCTIRVWDLVTGAQRYQFFSPSDRPTCVAYAPPAIASAFAGEPQLSAAAATADDDNASAAGGAEAAAERATEAALEERHLVAGYVSGAVRVFDVPSVSTLFELEEHHGAVQQVVFTPDGSRLISAGEDGLLCLYDTSQGYHVTRVLACDEPLPGRPISLAVSPWSDRLAVIGNEPSCILLYDLATMVLKGRLGRTGHKGARFSWGSGGSGCGGSCGILQPWRHRAGSVDWVGAGGAAAESAGGAAAAAGVTAAGGGFLHVAFSGDGADLLACTATKFFRFPLGGSDVHAWSALLPCKSGPAMATCNPSTGPGLVLVSPAPTFGTGDVAAGGGAGGGPAGNGGGGTWGNSKRGAAPRALGWGSSAPLAPSELFLSQVHRDGRSAAVVISAPQAFAAHASPVTAAAFSARGDRVITCDGTGAVLLWANLAAPEPGAWAVPTAPPIPSHSAAAEAAAVGGEGLTPPGSANPDASGPREEGGRHLGKVEGDGGSAAAQGESSQREGGVVPPPLDIPQEEDQEERQSCNADKQEGEATTSMGTGVSAATSGSVVPKPEGLPPTATPMELGLRAGEGKGSRGFASMLDQTPPPTMQQQQRARHDFAETEGRAGANQGARPGQLEEAIRALQTVVDDAAAAVGEGGNGGDGSNGGQKTDTWQPPAAEPGARSIWALEIARSDDDDGSEEGDGGDEARDGGGAPSAGMTKTRPISPRAPSASSAGGRNYHPHHHSARVSWHPASARLFYTEGASFFAEDLETCRRWALFPAGGSGGGGGRISCVAVSTDGSLVACGSSSSQRARPTDGGGDRSGDPRLSLWHLGRDAIRKPRSLSYIGGGGGGEDVIALTFSPSGSDLCSLGGWDGTRCLLRVRPASGLVFEDSPTAEESRGRLPLQALGGAAAAPGVVIPLSAKTSAICMLPAAAAAAAARRRDAAEGEPEPFIFVTGGEEGVALWRRGFDDWRGRGKGGGGVRLLGTAAGRRATALASAGRFVVAADAGSGSGSSSEGDGRSGGEVGSPSAAPPTLTAIDLTWLAAGGCEAEMKGLVADPGCTWRVLRGSDAVGGASGDDEAAIACLASAGPRRVAVAGSGSKLEIWDVEAACGGGDGGENFAGLVHRLDLGDALQGGSVTDMTWDAGGTDAVLGSTGGDGDCSGGGIWHLRLPQGEQRGGGEPTLARLWPGGAVKAHS